MSCVMLVSGRLKGQMIVTVVNKKTNLIEDLRVLSNEEIESVNNIYIANVKALVNSLNALFVCYDPQKRDAFLSTSRVGSFCLDKRTPTKKETPAATDAQHKKDDESLFYDDEDDEATAQNTQSLKKENEAILSGLKVGQKLLVQVLKDERGSKGATLTTYIKIAGTYLVIMPNNTKALGISRHITEEQRQKIKEIVKKLKIPANMGIIVRTAGTTQKVTDLQAELDRLVARWNAIKKASEEHAAPRLIYEEGSILIRTMRDLLRRECEEIIIDDQEAFENINDYLNKENKQYVEKMLFYQDERPLFDKFPIQKQIDAIYNRHVPLSSGAELVIDPTEALTSIDINSAKATKGGSIHETALTINLEAAKEIARQIRHRNLSGLIVIDFIDMIEAADRKRVELSLAEGLSEDRAKVQVLPISPLGLLTLSRQGIGSSIFNNTFSECPRCKGIGRIRNTESLSISILRNIEEQATHEQITLVQAYMPVPVASFLLNEKTDEIRAIQERQHVKLHIIPDMNLDIPEYKIKRFRTTQPQMAHEFTPATKNYDVDDLRGHFPGASKKKSAVISQESATKEKPTNKKKNGMIQKIMKKIFTDSSEEIKADPALDSHPQRKHNRRDTRGTQTHRRSTSQNRNYNRSGRSGGRSDAPNRTRSAQHDNRGRSNTQTASKTQHDNRGRSDTQTTSKTQHDNRGRSSTQQPGNTQQSQPPRRKTTTPRNENFNRIDTTHNDQHND
jgi:ribonuclease E